VLSAFDWQLVHCVIVHHLRNAVERLAELPEYKPSFVIGYDLHMHEAGNTPASQYSEQLELLLAYISVSCTMSSPSP